MRPEKQGWDKRAWLVGILGGTVGGNVTAWASYPPLTRHLNAALHQSSAADWISGVFGFAAVLVLPGVVSGLARKLTFLWGIVTLLLFLLAIEAEDWVENGPKNVANEFWVGLLAIGGCLLVSSGPVSLIRYLRVRSVKNQEAAQAAVLAQREAASAPQEGVWPPPPDYRK